MERSVLTDVQRRGALREVGTRRATRALVVMQPALGQRVREGVDGWR